MEKMLRNMESMTVKKVVLKRVVMMMMTMMLPVRKAIKNDAAWPLHHPVMHDALCQCQDVKTLTDRTVQCYKALDLSVKHCLPCALHGKTLHNNSILFAQYPRACCMEKYHQNWCCYTSSHVSSLVMYTVPAVHYALELLLDAAQLAFTHAVS